MKKRGTTNSNSRGSSLDRRRRKEWLLLEFGDGIEAPCSFENCTEVLTFDTITVDRYPLPGILGGTYVRSNIRPACSFHNSQDGSLLGHRLKAERLSKV